MLKLIFINNPPLLVTHFASECAYILLKSLLFYAFLLTLCPKINYL